MNKYTRSICIVNEFIMSTIETKTISTQSTVVSVWLGILSIYWSNAEKNEHFLTVLFMLKTTKSISISADLI